MTGLNSNSLRLKKFKINFLNYLAIDLVITALVFFSLFFYWQSLIHPAFGCNYFGADSGRYNIENGLPILMFGLLGVLVLNIAWFANLTYFLSFIFLLAWMILVIFKIKNKNHKALLVSKILFWMCIATIILALDTYALFLDVKLGKQKQVGIYEGFYFWMASFALLFLPDFRTFSNPY